MKQTIAILTLFAVSTVILNAAQTFNIRALEARIEQLEADQ